MNDSTFDPRPAESFPGERAWNGLSAGIALLGAACAAWCLSRL